MAMMIKTYRYNSRIITMEPDSVDGVGVVKLPLQ